MRIRLSPRFFFAGLTGGLVCLSWLGATVQIDSLTNHFVRFHPLINVEGGFFPTAREVVDIVDGTGDDPSLIYVIVGGSSVFHGVGQHESLVWTRVLQGELGDRFRVINFAQRAGGATDFGNIAAEYLIRNSKRVIYVGNANSFAGSLVASPETSVFRHIIFDAWQRNILLPWPPRDRMLSRAILDATDQVRGVAIGAFLNRYLNFNELWNYISFEFVNLNWNSLLATQSFHARRQFADPELLPQQYEPLRYRDDIDVTMRIQRAQIVASNYAGWARSQNQIDMLIPPELRKVTLCVLNLDSPYYRRRLSKNEQQDLFATVQASADLLAGLGFNWIVFPSADFSDEDYVDRVHMSASGGQKLAIAIAPTIKKMAMHFGYIK